MMDRDEQLDKDNQLGKAFDEYIHYWTKTILQYTREDELPPVPEYVATDNIGEIVEKLVILHIRTWKLEDAAQAATTDQELAEIKRKIDLCFKVKRPKLIEAFNRLMEDAVANNRSLLENSVKMYKGIENG